MCMRCAKLMEVVKCRRLEKECCGIAIDQDVSRQSEFHIEPP